MSWKLFFQIVLLILVAGIVMSNTWYLRIFPIRKYQFKYHNDRIFLVPHASGGCWEINPQK